MIDTTPHYYPKYGGVDPFNGKEKCQLPFYLIYHQRYNNRTFFAKNRNAGTLTMKEGNKPFWGSSSYCFPSFSLLATFFSFFFQPSTATVLFFFLLNTFPGNCYSFLYSFTTAAVSIEFQHCISFPSLCQSYNLKVPVYRHHFRRKVDKESKDRKTNNAERKQFQ